MVDKRPALGRGLSALIPDAPAPRRRRRPRPLEVDTDLLQAESVSAAHARWTRARSTSWRDRFAPTASSSRSSSARPTAATRSSPASAAGARRSAPACSRCPIVVRDMPGRSAARRRADREHPARRSEPDRRGAGLPPAHRRIPPDAGADRRRRRQRSIVDRELRCACSSCRASARRASPPGTLAMGHARALLGLPDEAAQLRVGREVVAKQLSVRETEVLVKKVARARAGARRAAEGRPHARRRREAALRARHAASASSASARGGRIEVDFDRKKNCSASTNTSPSARNSRPMQERRADAMTVRRLTDYAACAGCASKLAAGELAQVLGDLPVPNDPRVLDRLSDLRRCGCVRARRRARARADRGFLHAHRRRSLRRTARSPRPTR